MNLSNYSLLDMMYLPLPAVHEQKKLAYRPTAKDVKHVYKLLNEHVFDNELYMPTIHLVARCRQYWGMCMGETKKHKTGSFCEIRLMDKWFCPQWFVTTLAHEMVHQYQWDVLGPEREKNGKDWLMSHGPSFFQFRENLEYHGISLKTAHSQRRWFQHQNLFRA